MTEIKGIVPERGGVPMYDPAAVRRIMDETGCSAQDAVLIAATEMDGASETRAGVNATQTACHVLRYPESLPPRGR